MQIMEYAFSYAYEIILPDNVPKRHFPYSRFREKERQKWKSDET